MATYVLVHGAWHGGWCRREVATRLRAAGHQVLTPTLTGLGERAHLRTPETGLSTHVADICGVLTYEGVHDAVLVGHSYAGVVVREAADRMPERVGRLVMLDAWACHDGQSIVTRGPDGYGDWVDAAAEGDALPVPQAAAVGVTDPVAAAWLQPLLTPQPRRTFTEPTRLTGAVERIPCRAVLCRPGRIPFGDHAAEFGWDRVTLDSGHDAMVTVPGELTRVLLDDAR